jgi:protein-tyrosine phosphatase
MRLSEAGGLGVLFMAALLPPVGCHSTTDPAGLTVLPPGDAETGRWIVLDGANNTRDLGGYPTADGHTVRWKTVLRSAELSQLSPAGCQAFQALAIRRVIDFRNRLAVSPLFDGDAVCVFQASAMSLLPVRGADSYVQTVVDNADAYREAFNLVGDPANLPLLYHCAAGKDRTGIMSALLLTLLGVNRDTVLTDYMLSNEVGATVEETPMIVLLDEVDRQGGIREYLGSLGVAPETQDRIRMLLLD